MKCFPSLVILFALIFSLKAQGQNPIFTTNPIVTVNQGQDYFYTVQAINSNGGAISYSSSLPSWLSLGSSENAVVTTFAGSVASGFQEGTGANASLNGAAGIAVDTDGNIFVADRLNHRIRKITPDGVVSTFVGAGRAGFKNGKGTEAILNMPSDLVFDAAGNIIFVDTGNFAVRKISKDGQVSTIVGSGLPGYKDAIGLEAQFGFLSGIALDSEGNLYLTDNGNKAIRKVTPELVVSTIASSSNVQQPTSIDFQSIYGIALDASKNIYVGDWLTRNIKKITPSGSVTIFAGSGARESTDGQGVSASFSSVDYIEFDFQGNLLVADGNVVRVISPEANVTTLNIGVNPVGGQSLGSFNVVAIALDSDGNILTTSAIEGKVLKTFNDGTTTLLAGGAQVPSVNDSKLNSTFKSLQSVAVKGDGTVYFTEFGSSTIRKISIDGSVTTVAGSSQNGYQDERGSEAKFSQFLKVTVDKDGWVYISDQGNNVIRRIDDNGLVTTFAGSGQNSHADGQGTSASFQNLGDITTDLDGNVYIIDQFRIRAITPFGVVSTLAGTDTFGFLDGVGGQANFGNMMGIDTDASGNIFVVDNGNVRIRKITPIGQVSTIAGSGIRKSEDGNGLNASFNFPQSIAVTNSGKIYISDAYQLKVIDEQLNVSTIAGKDFTGATDGIGSEALFSVGLMDFDLDKDGNLLVADFNNYLIRKVLFSSPVLKGNAGNNVGIHNVSITATDEDGNEAIQSFQIEVIDTEDPVFTSATTANFAENGTGIAYTITATDASPLTYSLGTENDEALFNVNATTGEVTFKLSPDFELPADANRDNSYVVEVKASDGANIASQNVTITISDVLDEINPLFTSTAAVSFAENRTGTVYTITATDASPLTYSLGTENDEAFFNVDATNGEVTFKVSPDFENPLDANKDNAYVIEVKAIDGANTSSQSVTITVSDVIELPPSVTIASTAGTPFTSSSVDISIIFSEPVIGFTLSDITTTSGVLSGLSGSGSTYTVSLTPSYNGDITIGVASDVAQSIASSIKNIASNSLTISALVSGLKTSVTGVVSSDIIWRKVNSPYVLISDVGVSDGVTLTIEPGVVVERSGDYQIIVDGKLNAAGTSSEFIEFKTLANNFSKYFLSFQKAALSDQTVGYLKFTSPLGSTSRSNAIQVGNETEHNQASVKNTGNLIINNSQFNYSNVLSDGYQTTAKVYIKNSKILNSQVKGNFPLSEPIFIEQSEVRNSIINSDSYNAGITIDRTSIYDSEFKLGCCGANFVVKDSYIYKSAFTEYNNYGNVDVADSRLINTYISLPQHTVNITRSIFSSDPIVGFWGGNSPEYLIKLSDGKINNSWLGSSSIKGVHFANDKNSGSANQVEYTTFEGFTTAITKDRVQGTLDVNHSTFKDISNYYMVNNAGLGLTIQNSYIDGITDVNDGTKFLDAADNVSLGAVTRTNLLSKPNTTSSLTRVTGVTKKLIGGNVVLNWSANTESDVAGYYVHYGTKTDFNYATNTDVGTVLAYVVVGGDINVEYSVTAYDGSKDGTKDQEQGNQSWFSNLALVNSNASPLILSSLVSSVVENSTNLSYSIVAIDNELVVYSLGINNDEAIFNVNTTTGEINFKTAPDFENPLDANKDNSYVIEVIASDGLNVAKQLVTISVTDLDEIAPVFTSSNTTTFAENGTGTAYTITATDANSITYSLGTGNDEAFFDLAAGVVTFKNVPDFETKSSYTIEVRANDGLNESTQTVVITITDVDEILPVFTSSTAVNFAENGTGTAYTITATDANAITYSLGTGNDEAFFNIAAGVVTFKNVPDFETKSSYTIEVRANDGLNESTQTVVITITDVDEILPVFTSATAVNFAENGTGTAYTITATDANAITYSLGTGNDEALFNIAAGIVAFKTAPDFETKSSYKIQVKASDGLNTASQNVTITITDVDEILPVFTSATTVNFAENGTATAYAITATDANAITYSLGNGNDESLFELNNGNVKFKVTPDFETPLDANKDNTYVIEVLASDGLNIAKQTVSITVTDIDEIKPSVVISTDASATVFTPSIKVSVKFSETVNGLEAADYETVNATISEFKGQGDTYTFLLTSVSDGEISVKLKANAVVDGALNNNEASAVLSRIVEARNESPTEILLDVASINENIAVRTLIGLLSAKDVDLNDSHQFILVGGTGSTNNASFEIIGNKLFKKVDISFDFETTKTQSIRIKTIDVRGGDFEAGISIAILNVAEPSYAISVVNPSDYETNNNALMHGSVKVGSSGIRQIKVSNTSPDAVLTVSDLKLPTEFTTSETTFNLEIGSEKILDITFKPESEGLKIGALQVISNAGNKSLVLGALATINKAPIAVAPGVRVDYKTEERIELRGYDPDGDPIEFVIVEGPSLGTLTATADAGFYSFVPSALAPEERHQDQIKFKVVEKGGGLYSNEAILKFSFNVADQKHVLKTLSVSEPTADQMTFTLNFEDKVFNSNYRLTVQYFDIQNGIRTDLLDANKPKSSMTIDGDQAALTFDAAKANHPLLFSASRVPMLITLSSANGNSATEVYFLEGQTGNRGILKAFDSGSSDGNHLVFAGLTSVPENETREVKMFAIELGDFSLANSTIAITKNPLYGTITSPSQVDLKTNVVSWSVNYTSTQEVGSLDSLEFTVTNPERNTVLSAYARIEVIEVPDAPALSLLSNVEINEDETLSIDIKATDLDSELEFGAVSSDGTNVPVSLTNGKLQISPIKDFNGVVNISVSVTEKGVTSPLSDFDDFQLTIVPVNDAPVVSAIQDVTINEDGETIIELSATDVDASIPEFDFQAAVNSPTDVSFTIVGNQMTIKPSADYFGELTFNIKADDRTGTSTSLSRAQSFKLNVLPVNDAPTVTKALSTQTLIEGFPTYGLDLSNFFTDKEKASKDLIYSVTNLSNVTLSITGSVLNISSVAGNTGLQTAQVTVSDGELSVSQSLNFITAASSVDITVANALSDITLNEDFGTATIDLAGVFSYAINPNAAFNYSLAGNQSLSATISNGKIELQSLADFNGADQLFVTGLVDGKAKLISFKINVGPVNDAPTLVNLINDISVDEDATLSSVILANTFADVDNDVLIYAASYTAAWLTFDPSTRTFSGTPNNDQVGEVEVTVIATDPSGAKAEDAFKIVVNNTNDAPTSISINANSLNENVAVGTLVGSLSSADVDKGDTNFSYTLVTGTGADDNGQFAIVGNQLLTLGNFDFESKASYSIRVRTVDGFEGSFTQAMTITVNNVNESPTDISIDNSQIAENSPISSQVGAFASTDPDTGDTHSYTLVVGEGDDNNAFFEISGNKLLTRSELDYETKQSYSIRIKTQDGAGLGFEEVFIVTVVNEAEAILRLEGGESPEITNVGETSNISVVIHNDGDGVLNITAITYPSGFSGQSSITGIEPSASQTIEVIFTPTEAKAYSGDIVFTYNGGTSTKSVLAEAQLVTSIEEGFIVEEEVTIFPNPAMDEFTIDLIEYNYRAVDVMIITESGVSMYERTKIKATKHTVNVSNYSQGVFIVLIKSEFGVIRKKLVISR